MAKVTKQADDQLVRYFKQSNAIIEAKYKLKYVEKCVFAKAYMMVEEADLAVPHKTYRIYIKDLIRDFGLSNDGLTYQKVRDWARELRKKELSFPYVDDEGNLRTVYSGFFTSVTASNEVADAGRDAYIEVEFDRRLKPYLVAAKKYTLFNQKRYEYICSKLHNATLIRLYEILKQYYRQNSDTSEKWFDVQGLKDILGVSDNYQLYGSFKQKVLVFAQERFEKFADIRFDFVERKTGRSVTDIKFIINASVPTEAEEWVQREVQAEMELNRQRKNAHRPPTENAESEVIATKPLSVKTGGYDALFQQAQRIGISPATLEKTLQTNELQAVLQGLDYTEFEAQKGKIKDNLDGYFVKAVKNRYTSASFERAQKQKSHLEERQRLVEEAQRLHDNIFEQQNSLIRELVAQDNEATQRAIGHLLTQPKVLAYAKKKKWHLEEFSIDDWRHDETLREFVIEAIVLQNQSHFADLQPLYAQLHALRKELKA
jgi:plasmid replication initiation protein